MTNWKLVKLEEIVTFQEGYVNPPQTNNEYFDGNVKWLRAVDLNDSEVWNTSRKLTDVGFESAGKSALMFKPNTIAISKSGTIGRLGILKDYMCGNRAVINIEVDDEKADLMYVFYSLIMARREIIQYAVGSVQANLYPSVLGKLEIPLPPISTQKKIASVISVIDNLKINNQNTSSKNNDIIDTLFRSWFIDFDPVKAKLEGELPFGMDAETAELFPDSFETSKYGEIPTGWNYVFLEDLATLTKKSLNPKQKPDEKFFHYSIPAYDNGANPILTFGDDIESNKFIVPDNCVLLSKLNPKWNRVWIPELSSDYVGIASTEFLPWVPKNGVSVYYLYSLMVSQPFRWLMDSRISGTTGSHQRVRPDDCAKIPCLMPSLEVMKKFHDAVVKMFEMTKNSAKTEINLVITRDALLPRLMSGELLVP